MPNHYAVKRKGQAVAYYDNEADARAAAPTYNADPADVAAEDPPPAAPPIIAEADAGAELPEPVKPGTDEEITVGGPARRRR